MDFCCIFSVYPWSLSGSATVTAPTMALARFPQLESAHGRQPMRLSKEPIFNYHGTMFFPKGTKWVREVDHAIMVNKITY